MPHFNKLLRKVTETAQWRCLISCNGLSKRRCTSELSGLFSAVALQHSRWPGDRYILRLHLSLLWCIYRRSEFLFSLHRCYLGRWRANSRWWGRVEEIGSRGHERRNLRRNYPLHSECGNWVMPLIYLTGFSFILKFNFELEVFGKFSNKKKYDSRVSFFIDFILFQPTYIPPNILEIDVWLSWRKCYCYLIS